MANVKTTLIILAVGLIKNIFLYKMSYLLEPQTHSNNKAKIELDLANYTTKSDLKILQVLIHLNLLKKLVYLA